MKSEWTPQERKQAGVDLKKMYRKRGVDLIDVAYEAVMQRNRALCQRKRALAALEAIVPPGDDWWCPTCKQALDGAHVTNQECCDTCGTYLAGINSPEWVDQANAAIAACKKGDAR